MNDTTPDGLIQPVDVAVVAEDPLWGVEHMNAIHVDLGDARVDDFVTVLEAFDHLTPGHPAVLTCGPNVTASVLDQLPALRAERPELGFVFAVDDTTGPLAGRVRVEAGQEPFATDDVARIVDAVDAALAERRAAARRASRSGATDDDADAFALVTGPSAELPIVAVTSAKGGTGATTAAINLALALDEAGAGRVVLVDAHKTTGDIAFLLGLGRTEHADIAEFEIDDETVLHFGQSPAGSSLVVVTPPTDARTLGGLTVEQLLRLLVALERHSDVVVLDIPVALAHDAGLLTYANAFVFVTGGQLTSVKNTLIATEIIGPAPEVRVLVNDATNSGRHIEPGEIEDTLQVRVLASLPFDDAIAAGAVANPASARAGARSKYAKDIARVAAQLLEEIRDGQRGA